MRAAGIITSRVHEILSAKPFPFEIRMDRTLPKDMPLYKPLAIEPPPLAALLHGAPVQLLIRIGPLHSRGLMPGDKSGFPGLNRNTSLARESTEPSLNSLKQPPSKKLVRSEVGL
jgi:hypothetical protein